MAFAARNSNLRFLMALLYALQVAVVFPAHHHDHPAQVECGDLATELVPAHSHTCHSHPHCADHSHSHCDFHSHDVCHSHAEHDHESPTPVPAHPCPSDSEDDCVVCQHLAKPAMAVALPGPLVSHDFVQEIAILEPLVAYPRSVLALRSRGPPLLG